MNQVFVGGIALIIALILWGTKKQSKGSPFLKSQKDSFVNSNSTISFVQKSKLINHEKATTLKDLKSKPFLISLHLIR